MPMNKDIIFDVPKNNKAIGFDVPKSWWRLDIETDPYYPFDSKLPDLDLYNIMYASTTVEEEEVKDYGAVKIGDEFTGALIGTVKVIHISDFDQVLIEYSDGSVALFETAEDFLESDNFDPLEASGWINVIYDNDAQEIYFDDGVYVTKENAINAFNHDKLDHWTLIDTTFIEWKGEV